MSQAAEFRCARCAAGGPRLAAAPMPGPAGAELVARVCATCWSEWTKREVMVINELRLNFMEPDSLAVLDAAMREFLFLESAPPGGLPAGTGETAT